jgi:hypothetical protein
MVLDGRVRHTRQDATLRRALGGQTQELKFGSVKPGFREEPSYPKKKVGSVSHTRKGSPGS